MGRSALQVERPRAAHEHPVGGRSPSRHRRPALRAARAPRDDSGRRGGGAAALVRATRLDLDRRPEPPDHARVPRRRVPERRRVAPARRRPADRVLGPRGLSHARRGVAPVPPRDAGGRTTLVRGDRPHPSPPARARPRRDPRARPPRLAAFRRGRPQGRDVGLEAGQADARAPLEPRGAGGGGTPGLPATLRPARAGPAASRSSTLPRLPSRSGSASSRCARCAPAVF